MSSSNAHILILLICTLLMSGCGPRQFTAPDNTKFRAAVVRVEKALPVVKQKYEQLDQRIREIEGENSKATEAHKATGATIEALTPQVERLKKIAFATSPSDVNLLELKQVAESLESWASQLQTSHETTSLYLDASTSKVKEARAESDAFRSALSDVQAQVRLVTAEGDKLNAEHARTLQEANAEVFSQTKRGDKLGNLVAIAIAAGVFLASTRLVGVNPYTWAYPFGLSGVAYLATYFLTK